MDRPVGGPLPSRAHHVLLVIGDQTMKTCPLPTEGKVSIGRSAENTVCVDDAAVSRRHAVLHVGETMQVEDLGSANGTYLSRARLFTEASGDEARTAEVLDRRLEPGVPVSLTPEAVIKVGSTTLAVQRGSARGRLRRLWPHGYFEGCLEDECARAERSKSTFAVLRLHVEGSADRSVGGVVEEALASATRTGDVVALYGPGEYEVLLVDAEPTKAEEVSGRIQGALTRREIRARTGLACYPLDGRSPESLLAKACARLEAPATGTITESRREHPVVVIRDPAMHRLYALAERVADSTISVLILGETGVGKEVLAETIHRLSPRSDGPFLRLNCASLPESLLESELFGHERGAFTGAVQAKPGLLESAHGGTVFLDEVGEIAMATQARLLRVLEERQVMRVGALRPRTIDVRFIAATNRDLEQEVARGAFREDLYFRLSGIPLLIPPLRERTSEIEPLARALIAYACQKSGRDEQPDIDDAALETLRAYRWPGNIRELRNVMERAVLLCGRGPIAREHLPVEKMGETFWQGAPSEPLLRPAPPPPPSSGARLHPGAPPSAPSMSRPTVVPPAGLPAPPPTSPDLDGTNVLPAVGLRDGVENAERHLILQALERCAGNQTQAAKLLGISRRTLVSRLAQYQIPRPRKGA